jgi:hypothetical protein
MFVGNNYIKCERKAFPGYIFDYIYQLKLRILGHYAGEANREARPFSDPLM